MPSRQAGFSDILKIRRWSVAAAILLLFAGAFSAFQFGQRSLGSFMVLRSAYEVGVPALSTLRGWMTLDYISSSYDVPLDHLEAGLELSSDTATDTPIFKIARERQQSRTDIIHAVQIVIADEGTYPPGDLEELADETGDTSLVALLTNSYPALALVLFLGAIGAPVPTGFATVLAGVLSANGTMSWPIAAAIAVLASIAGDLVGFGIGRWAGEGFVARRGGLLGYSGKRKARIEWLFRRWGGFTVFLTRTLVSHLSSLASILAGLSAYAFLAFLAFAITGRVVWTAAYFGAGYYIGADIEASAGFLEYFSGFAISLFVAVVSAIYLVRGWCRAVAPAD